MGTIVLHYSKDGVRMEATYTVEPRHDRREDESVYRKIPNSEKKCECTNKG